MLCHLVQGESDPWMEEKSLHVERQTVIILYMPPLTEISSIAFSDIFRPSKTRSNIFHIIRRTLQNISHAAIESQDVLISTLCDPRHVEVHQPCVGVGWTTRSDISCSSRPVSW